MRAFMKFVRNKGGSGTLGGDADPSATAPPPNADNVCRVPSQSSWSGGLKRLALMLDGPSDLAFEVWIKEDLTDKWFKAVASTALTKGAVTYAVIPAPTNIPSLTPTGIVRDDFVEVFIRPTDPGAAGNGNYTIALAGDYTS